MGVFDVITFPFDVVGTAFELPFQVAGTVSQTVLGNLFGKSVGGGPRGGSTLQTISLIAIALIGVFLVSDEL